jgi:Eukaryotic aspartyl protease
MSDLTADLVKRTNTYPVASPAVPTQTQAAGIAQDGTDFSYFVQVKVGAIGKPLWMLLDTGAATTWVMGAYCASSACSFHTSFGPADSTSLQISTTPFSVAYGSGSVGGYLATDSFALAGMSIKYQFGLANQTSDDFVHFPFDGILGMSMSKGDNQNYLQAVKDSKQVGANIFSVFLNRNSDGPNTGEITFGAVDPAKYTGDIVYTPVSGGAAGDWAIPLDAISYNGQAADGVKGKLAYIDTGTSYIFGPQADVAALYKLIPGAATVDGETYTVPCDSAKPLTFTFSGVSFTVQQHDWMSAPSSSGVCTSNIYAHDVVPGAWLLGDVFLKNVYAVFDTDKTRIGKTMER